MIDLSILARIRVGDTVQLALKGPANYWTATSSMFDVQKKFQLWAESTAYNLDHFALWETDASFIQLPGKGIKLLLCVVENTLCVYEIREAIHSVLHQPNEARTVQGLQEGLGEYLVTQQLHDAYLRYLITGTAEARRQLQILHGLPLLDQEGR